MGPEEIAIRMRLRGAAQYQTEMARNATATARFGASAERAGAQSKRGATGIAAMSAAANTGISSFSKLKKHGETMKNTGRTMTYGMTLPLAAAGYMAIKTAGDFQRSMAQIKVATGTSAMRIESLEDVAKDLGASTKFSATEAAQAMLDLAKAGIKPAQIEAGALKSAMTLAAAGSINLGEAAVLTGTSMNAFGLKAKNAGQIADALAGGANASAAEVSQLATSLSQGGTQAAAYGISLNETVGALAAFAESGIKGSDAGTSFKTFLARLNPVTAKAKDKMNELGMSFFDSHGKLLPLPQVAAELRRELGGMSDKARGAAINILFGSDAMRAANVFYKEGAGGIKKMTKATEQQGAAQKMSNAFMEGMAGTMEKTRGALENMALAVGFALAPVITQLAESIEFLAEGFSGLPGPVQKVIVFSLMFLAVAGPLLMLVGSMAIGITALATAFAALSLPVIIIAAAVLALGAAIYLVATNFDTWGKYVVIFLISPALLFWTTLVKSWGKISGFVGGVVSDVGRFLKKIPGFIWGVAKQAPKALGFLVGFFLTLPFRIAAALVNLVPAVAAKAVAFFSWWKSLPGKVIAAVIDLGPKLLSFGAKAVGKLVDGVKSGVGAIKSFFSSLPGKIVDWILEHADDLLQVGKDLSSQFMSGFASSLPGPVKDVLGIDTVVPPGEITIVPGALGTETGGGNLGGGKGGKKGGGGQSGSRGRSGVRPRGRPRTLSTLGSPASDGRSHGPRRSGPDVLRVEVPVKLKGKQVGFAMADITLDDEANG